MTPLENLLFNMLTIMLIVLLGLMTFGMVVGAAWVSWEALSGQV